MVHMSSKKHHFFELMVIIAPVLGAMTAIFLGISDSLNYAFFGVVGGIMLFMVIREFIPKPKEAEPLYFIAGQLFFVLISLFKFMS